MPISLTDLRSDQRVCVLEWEGEKAEVVYRPSAYTPETEDTMRRAIESLRPAGGLAEILADVIVEWELLNDEGEAIAPTIEFMRTLPNVFLVAVSNAILEDVKEDRDDRKNSAGGSLRKGNKANARTGTH